MPRAAAQLPRLVPASAHAFSTANCTWKTFEQPIDHFDAASRLGHFGQRVCLFSSFWRDESNPIFFYTGNESPVEEYINATGLMWELGEKMGALIVFAEHRYEPASHPPLGGGTLPNCFAYCTTGQALADYASLIRSLRLSSPAASSAPVIAFGGSYGGMLAGWLRIRYPEDVAGAIAASAPVWGLASTLGQSRLDWSARAIYRGVSRAGGAPERCSSNLRAVWPLIEQVGQSEVGRSLLARAARSCRPSVDAEVLSSWAKAPWFFLVEGNFPYPSTYITFAVGPGGVPLPPWPMRVACANGLSNDFGVRVDGSLSDVRYTLRLGELSVNVSWQNASGNGASLSAEQIEASGVLGLVRALTDGVGVWYNVTGTKRCYDIKTPPDTVEEGGGEVGEGEGGEGGEGGGQAHSLECPACPPCVGCPPCPTARCGPVPPKACAYAGPVSNTFSWDGVTCNDDLWLYNNDVVGAGRDFYWPPSHRRGATVGDVVGPHALAPGCKLRGGLYGAPLRSDPWSAWLDAYYGGLRIGDHTNIVWSNGLLDPWSGGGVYPPSGGIDGPMVQNVSADGSQIALLIEDGAHHLDLFWADPRDPPSVLQARAIEEEMIRRWCRE